MLSVIIPTLNAAQNLPATLASLMPALMDDMIKEVLIIDGGSKDETSTIADTAGAIFLSSPQQGRGQQLKKGAASAKSDWLLFLHADTELEAGWHQEVRDFIKKAEHPKHKTQSAVFAFALKDTGPKPYLLTKLVALRCRLFALPYGDQGLLINKAAYEQAGGYAAIPLMEDVDLIRRLTPRPRIFKSRAFTCANRYQKDGYIKRSLQNLTCLTAYYRGHPPEKIKDWYETRQR